MAGLKPAYLVSGDDDARIDAWRARVRARAEAEGGPGALETFDGRSSSPAEVAAAVMALTFAMGTRYLLADPVEGWKAAELEPLESALQGMPPDSVLVLVARGKPQPRLLAAVQKAGGETRNYEAPRAKEMPSWVVERAAALGLSLDHEAASALVALVGLRQQHLAREIEKLAIAAHPAVQLSAAEVRRLAAGASGPGAYDVADAVVAGDVESAIALAEALHRFEDRPSKLVFPIVRRLREVHVAAELLDSGMSEAEAAKTLKGPPWIVKRTIAKARKADRETLEQAICTFAELEVELRGGGDLDEDTAFSRALVRAATAG